MDSDFPAFIMSNGSFDSATGQNISLATSNFAWVLTEFKTQISNDG